jgi:predicted SprT family Zn-dependent metalloprotease
MTHFTPDKVQQEVEKAVKITNVYWRVACKKWRLHNRIEQLPPIQFNLKGAIAGLAHVRGIHNGHCSYDIKYNLPKLLTNVDYFYSHTIPHEVSHIIAWLVSGEMDHGTVWKNVMRSLGCENAARTYALDHAGKMVDPRSLKDQL